MLPSVIGRIDSARRGIVEHSIPATCENRLGAAARLPAFENFHQRAEIARPDLDRWRCNLSPDSPTNREQRRQEQERLRPSP
jgi:hypothetical protein